MAPWIKYLPYMYEDMSSDIKNKACTSMERYEAGSPNSKQDPQTRLKVRTHP